ncbi:hypothetical protein DFH08DRAFT_815250 [Mycena albidolilacea]|uniref:Uncharacterized protein n=1 Tax=Mycena albidolilacea TaxID=1033008 RepID=A0AAD6ZMJ1_9AGAR|nr:hypothetical protein DFH08DRAFT_815250 [Mycena albidolilacea]
MATKVSVHVADAQERNTSKTLARLTLHNLPRRSHKCTAAVRHLAELRRIVCAVYGNHSQGHSIMLLVLWTASFTWTHDVGDRYKPTFIYSGNNSKFYPNSTHSYHHADFQHLEGMPSSVNLIGARSPLPTPPEDASVSHASPTVVKCWQQPATAHDKRLSRRGSLAYYLQHKRKEVPHLTQHVTKSAGGAGSAGNQKWKPETGSQKQKLETEQRDREGERERQGNGLDKPDGLYMVIEWTEVVWMEWTVRMNWNQGLSNGLDAGGKGLDPRTQMDQMAGWIVHTHWANNWTDCARTSSGQKSGGNSGSGVSPDS